MSVPAGSSTLDSNIAVYVFTLDPRRVVAAHLLTEVSFVSAQVLNEYSNVARRKLSKSWQDIAVDVADIRGAVGAVLPILEEHTAAALRLANRYQLSFYDALMLAVALFGGASVFYSEDMQHGMTIDETLRVVDPFRPGALDA